MIFCLTSERSERVIISLIITSDTVITSSVNLFNFLGDVTWSLFFWATQRNGFWEGITCTLSYFLVFCVSYVEVPHASSPFLNKATIGYLTQNDIIYPSIWWFCHGNHLHRECETRFLGAVLIFRHHHIHAIHAFSAIFLGCQLSYKLPIMQA